MDEPGVHAVPTWDGVTRGEALTSKSLAVRHELADRARAFDWTASLSLLSDHPELINVTRPDGHSRFAVLHQAAFGGAPAKVVEQLLALGAWRTLRSAEDERPVDIARRRGHAHLLPLLEPVLVQDVPPIVLGAIQQHLHDLIYETPEVERLVREHELRLPQLEPLLELSRPEMWFPVPGMYGGFHLQLEHLDRTPVLVSSSWCRIADGWGTTYVISQYGKLLIKREDRGLTVIRQG